MYWLCFMHTEKFLLVVHCWLGKIAKKKKKTREKPAMWKMKISNVTCCGQNRWVIGSELNLKRRM